MEESIERPNELAEINVSLQDEQLGERIVPLLNIEHSELKEVLGTFGCTPEEEARTVGEGRIATNLMARTHEHDEVIVRIYPDSYSHSKVLFEIEGLNHIASAGLPVPNPLRTSAKDRISDHLVRRDDKLVMVYPALHGKTISQEELSVPIAGETGVLLLKYLNAAASFEPQTYKIDGDLAFIQGLLRTLKETNAEFASLLSVSKMEDVLLDARLHRELAHTPVGLVHADYFFENILSEGGNVSGLLDFGDAYQGHLLNDVVIGAMEFAVHEDERWDLDLTDAFLSPLAPWLREVDVSADLMVKLLLANCVRFAVYTTPFTQSDHEPVAQNPYVRRFESIIDSAHGDRLKEIFAGHTGKE